MLLFLLYPTTAMEPPALPDRRKSPRLLCLDTGLVNYRAGLQTGFLSPSGLGALYRGRLAEHVVGQELVAADLRSNDKPRFWVRQKAGATAEVDYLHRYRDRLVPVEVKSGRSGALRSLHQFMQRADHDLAVRLWDGTSTSTRRRRRTGAGSACSICPTSSYTGWTPTSIGRNGRARLPDAAVVGNDRSAGRSTIGPLRRAQRGESPARPRPRSAPFYGADSWPGNRRLRPRLPPNQPSRSPRRSTAQAPRCATGRGTSTSRPAAGSRGAPAGWRAPPGNGACRAWRSTPCRARPDRRCG